MRSDYLFKVVKSKSENLEGIANKELVIEVRCIQGNIGNLYLKLKISDSLNIDSVLFMINTKLIPLLEKEFEISQLIFEE